MTRPQPDPIAALREIAPEWARFFCVTRQCAFPFWQDSIDPTSPTWGIHGIEYSDVGLPFQINQLRGTAINIRTGAVYIRKGEKVIEVTRKEWDV